MIRSFLLNSASVALLCAALVWGSEQSSHGPLRLRRATETTVTVGAVTKLRLINADTNLPIAGYDPLPAVSRIDLNTLPTPNLSVEAITAGGTIESVGWRFESVVRAENAAPWAMCFNNGNDIYACKRLVAGFNSNITVTPFTRPSGRGTRGTPYTIQLSLFRGGSVPTKAPAIAPSPTKAPAVVVAPTNAPVNAPTNAPLNAPTKAPVNAPTKAPVKAPTEAPVNAPTKAPVNAPTKAPVNAPTKAPLEAPTKAPVPSSVGTVSLTFVNLSWNGVNTTLVNDGKVEYSHQYSFYTIKADVANSSVQSVEFTYDDKVVRIENEAPYVLAGKDGNGVRRWLPSPGRHTLVASAYSQKNASGVLLATTTVTFTAVLKDTEKPKLLKVRPSAEYVNRKSPPSTLELALMARDDMSGIARATVRLSTYNSFQNYTDHASVTVRFDDAIVASTKGKPFYFNVSIPYPKDLANGFYRYRVEAEDGAGNVDDVASTNWFGEFTDVVDRLTVYDRRPELLNVVATNSAVTVNTSGLPALVPVQITLKDPEGYSVCVSASSNGFSTDDAVLTEWGSTTTSNCLTLPEDRIRGVPSVMNFTLEMRPYFTTGRYNLKVSSWDYSRDAAFLASKNFTSYIDLINPNVKPLTPPVVKSLTALSSTTIDLQVSPVQVNVTTRLVLEDVVTGFDGVIEFWLKNRRAVTVSLKNNPLVAGQQRTLDVGLPIYERAGMYPLRLVFKDRFSNAANVTADDLAQQGYPIVVEVKATTDPTLSGLKSLYLSESETDISFGYRRVVLAYNFGFEGRFLRDGYLNLTATGASDSNRGVVLQGVNYCHPRYGSNYPYYHCFFLNESTPLGLYLISGQAGRGSSYDTAALQAAGFSSNFTVTSYIATGLGP